MYHTTYPTPPVQPPGYSPVPQATSSPDTPAPLSSPREGEEEVPEDFKYGVNVEECAVEIRQAFVRKVYALLGAQLALTSVVVGGIMLNVKARLFVQTHPWLLILSLVLTLGSLLLLYWKRRSHPVNLVLLGLFTLCESYGVGAVVSTYDVTLVFQALLLTTGLFLALTLYTLQSKRDFSGMGPFLYIGLWGVVLTGLVQIFVPFGRILDLCIASFSALLFAGYTIYDTYLIMRRVSCEEYVVAAVDLYLDFINLFLSILRILNDLDRD
ncbi:MAG: UPF0005-domain-containing protein [Piptocephalis tieghemiana]|nr:MAG: UPF0005-domain-containing protein [Piptocephalis tieghemiana]